MHIGLDFDNTIVCYDQLFHTVAVEQGLVPTSLPPSKIAVRNHLKAAGQEPLWTELQGCVYGTRMNDALPYPGIIAFLKEASRRHIMLTIISHKTKHPVIGPQYDLHQAARSWISNHLVDQKTSLIPNSHLFFETSQEKKLQRLSTIQCDYFIDDLPEILRHPLFPNQCQRILFDPDSHHRQHSSYAMQASSWQNVATFFNALQW